MGRYATRINPFKPGLITLNYLSKSNNYASISNKEVKEKIQAYESNLNWFHRIFEIDEEMGQHAWQIIPQIFDTKIFYKMKQICSAFKMPVENPKLLSNDPIIINQFAYILYLRKSQFFSELTAEKMNEINRKKLIDLLNQRYELR